MKHRDLSGLVFDDLTVVSKAPPVVRKSGSKTAWLCRCKCGKEIIVTQNALVSHTTKSCGCRNKSAGLQKRVDLVGKRFGLLTVIQYDHDHETPNGTVKRYWLCQCDCGNRKIISGDSLKNGFATSCGCVRSANVSKRTLKNLEGLKFGKLTVLTRVKQDTTNRHAAWLCLCECGNKTIVASSDLIGGHTLSCGCIGASRGEYEIAKRLMERHITFVREYSFDDLLGPNGGFLRFDFAILDSQYRLLGLIEYQGEQHYKDKKDSFGSMQKNITDATKKEYCENHNIPLREIKYTDDIDISLQNILETFHANPVPRLDSE